IRIFAPANAPKLGEADKAEPPATRVLSLLQDDKVHYNGQPIALVVAETLEQARAAAAILRIHYEEQPPAIDFSAGKTKAFTPEKANQHPTDVAWGDFDDGLRQADTKVDQVYTTPDQTHNPMEPHATVAHWHGGKLTVYDSTQGVFGCRKTLAGKFGLVPHEVHVISPFVGGGFGCKGSVWSHVVLAAMAAKAIGRPVKLALDRPQMFGPVGGRPRTEQHIVLGATRDGTLTAVRHAVTTTTSMIEDWVEPAAAPTRVLYACANGDTKHRLVKLNVGTPTFQRAPGEATGTFALEVAMDELAVALSLDPIALRLINYADTDPVEHKPFSSKHLRDCYHQGAEAFGWSARNPEPRSMRDGRWLVGYGMATATYPALRSPAAADASIHPDGSATVRAGTQDIGTGTYTVMTQVAADALGLPIDKVHFELGDTAMPKTPVSGGSQTAASVGSAVEAACAAVREKLLAAAVAGSDSPFACASPDQLSTAEGWVFDPADQSSRESYAAIMARNGGKPIQAHAETEPPADLKENYALHSFGATFAEVRVDPDLGVIRLERLHGTYDVGRRLNAKLAESQLIGGIVWAASMALFEHSMHDPHVGRIVNENLAEYHVPVNADIRKVSVAFIDSEDMHLDPLGIRGIGEIGITGMTAAIANAVYHATGKRIRDLPITLDKLM
ncbi:MAG: xanthine dehydrogenase family protein molybdopterin-binding subunit, partial [Rhodanobacteraceae bacterium]